MNTIFKHQAALQAAYAEKKGMPNPSNFDGMPVGYVLDYIRDMSIFAQYEINELLQEIAQGPQALKPWSSAYAEKRSMKYVSTEHIKSEAIDFLAFAINICLAAGITADNVETEYMKVFNKNTERQSDASY